MAETAIELVAATRNYGDRVALDNLSLNVPEGSRVAVLGANGAGKTTLLRLLCGLLRPHGGEVEVLGSKLPSEAWAIRGKVGLLAHEPMLYRALTVRENLTHQARLLNVEASRVNDLIGRVGMERRCDEPLRNLSRGMVQRAAAARAVLADPALMLLDEPYANLDPGGAALISPLLEDGRTVLISGHEPRMLLERSNIALGLRDGRAALFKPSSDVCDSVVEGLYR